MNKLYVFIKSSNQNSLLTKLYELNIFIDSIKYTKEGLFFYISKQDYKKISKYYKIKIIKEYSKKSILIYIKNNIIKLLFFIIGIILFLVFKNVIIEVEYKNESYSKNYELQKKLEEYKIKRLSFKKSFKEISNIKNKIMEEFNDSIEWLEIKNIGMTYKVYVEERKNKVINQEEGYCNIIANQDAIITKIISSSGQINVRENDYVKKGDILISGDITYNDEIKNTTCASGTIYGEVWYSMHLSVPKTYEIKKTTNKTRFNIMFENGNLDYKLFKSRLKNYDTTKYQIISLLGKKIILLKEQEYVIDTIKYQENEYDKKIDELIINNINLNLNDKEQILYKNILKKEEFDSTIEIEVFVTVEKIISGK